MPIPHRKAGAEIQTRTSELWLCQSQMNIFICPVLVQVIRQLSSQTLQFRVLALSATPGGDTKVRDFNPFLSAAHRENTWSPPMFNPPCSRCSPWSPICSSPTLSYAQRKARTSWPTRTSAAWRRWWCRWGRRWLPSRLATCRYVSDNTEVVCVVPCVASILVFCCPLVVTLCIVTKSVTVWNPRQADTGCENVLLSVPCVIIVSRRHMMQCVNSSTQKQNKWTDKEINDSIQTYCT